MPERIRFNRFERKPFPPNTKLVTRGSRWGNPFPVARRGDPATHAAAVERYREWIMMPEQASLREDARRELAGHDLACTCAPGLPCHGDVLLEIANQDADS
jgi:uncharacterized protein DUF4326